MLLPSEDPTTIRGKKKLLDRVTLVFCCNAIGIDLKVPITIIGKAKELACIFSKKIFFISRILHT